MKTWEIRVEGIVQGVGFRPTVYALAHQLQLFGTVSNGPEGVKILCSAPESLAQTFYQRILSQAPPNAIITRHSIHESAPKFFESFEILESQHCGTRSLLPTPDFGICEGCSKELHDPSNRRFGYPFITCTSCGPRYSILKDLPYDRPKTSMEEFPMCSACLEEYHDPEDRRHFSQTNSCATCGVSLSLHTGYRSGLFQGENEKIQHYILQAWRQGKIVAIKGIGGYLLTCDASDEQAIQALRARKDRPGKPFALMVPEVSRFDLSNSEERLFNSSVAPILLVEKPKDLGIASGVADGLSQVGIMRPYAPLFEWLLKPFGKPIVATSANIHQAPILYRDAEIEKLLQIADVVLSHNREIVVPQDDSVVKIAPASQQAILMRRSRGWAPNYLETLPQLSVDQIWAAGADLKSCMGFIHEKKVYLSQYLGDLSHADTEQHFLDTRRALKRLLQFRPKVLLADLHPGYVSTRLARNWGEENNIEVACIQHHRAHFAAILGEHRLFDSEDPILGFIWDGTGFGEDGNIWGGEGFLYHKSGMKRIGHVAYFPSIAGDKMAREPRLAALALL
ncbi:MAG: carbamoyltransferase HypF, partial [Bacteroidota bacterium]